MTRLTLLVVAALVVAVPAPAPAQEIPDPPVRYDRDHLPPGFHASRRAAVKDSLPEGSVAVFFGAPERTRQNDVLYEYRQDSDLLYLTGATEPGSALVLVPGGVSVDGETVTEVLFVPPRDPSSEVWTGRRLGPDGAEEVLGVEKALSADRFGEVLGQVVRAGVTLHHLALPDGVEGGSALAEQLAAFDAADAPREGARLRRVVTSLRTIKAEEELRLMQRAIDLTSEAHRAAMRTMEPGMHEYEIEAVVEYVFKEGGAEYTAFPSIVGSGENAVILHYETSRRRMEPGDLVVMDIGAEYHGYAADVTRTMPVSGRFSTEQRAVYELVLMAQEAGIEAARAGNAFQAPHVAAARVLAEGLAGLGLLDSPEDFQGLSRFFMHGTSHYLGLDVHDVGTGGALRPGTVLTVEPGIYIAPAPDIEPKWWNVGVRIEDDVLVTAEGPRVLSAGAPKTVQEIEEIMARPRTDPGPGR